MKRLGNEDLVKLFAECVTQAERAFLKDTRRHNRCMRRALRYLDELRQRGDEAVRALVVLLDHKEPGVRSLAAAYLLRLEPDLALSVLHDVARLGGLVGMGAKRVLHDWMNGGWRD